MKKTLLFLFITARAFAALPDEYENFILELNTAIEQKNTEKLYSFASLQFKKEVSFDVFAKLASQSDVDGVAAVSIEFGKKSALSAVGVRHGVSSGKQPTYEPMIFVIENGIWKYRTIPFIIHGPAGIIDKIESGISEK